MTVIETDWKWKSGLSTRLSTKCIVLHHAAAKICTAQQIDSWHKANGWSGIGYHFFIRKDGTIYRGRPEWAVGAHASGRNSNTIGVCVEGNYEEEKTMPQAQKEAVKEVLRYLKGKYPKAELKGHRDVGATGCPGKYYPMSEMVNYFNNESEEEPMTAEERTKFNKLVNAVSAVKSDVDELKKPKMIYNYIDDNMPEWAKEGVQWCVDNGIVQGTGDGLNLDDDKLWLCTVIYRTAKTIGKLINVKM